VQSTQPPPDPERSTGLLVIAGPVAGPEDVRRLCEQLRAVIQRSDAHVVVCDVSALPASARSIEALARLQLTARRLGRRIRLQRASRCLEELLEFAGLADVVSVNAPVGGEREGQPEHREHPLDVEEAVDRGDPAV
jgi:hypothetical protein